MSLDLSLDKPRKFAGSIFSEQELENVILRAAKPKSHDTQQLNTLSLDLSGADLSGDRALMVSDIIIRGGMFSFAHIDVSNTRLNNNGCESLLSIATECKQLVTLRMKSNNLSKEAGHAIGELLKVNPSHLQLLDISDNTLGDIGVASIAGSFTMDLSDIPPSSSSSVLVSLATLLVLDLSANDCGDMGVLALCRGLSQFARHAHSLDIIPALKVLRLSRNKIGDKGAHCLAQLIRKVSSMICLEELAIEENPIGPTGLVSLLQAISDDSNSKIKRLYIGRCNPSLQVLHAVSDTLSSPSCSLEALGIQFTEKAAQDLLNECKIKMPIDEAISSIITTLANSITLHSTHINNLKIRLGRLPDILCQSCVAANETDDFRTFNDTAGALCGLNAIKEQIGLSQEMSIWIEWLMAEYMEMVEGQGRQGKQVSKTPVPTERIPPIPIKNISPNYPNDTPNEYSSINTKRNSASSSSNNNNNSSSSHNNAFNNTSQGYNLTTALSAEKLSSSTTSVGSSATLTPASIIEKQQQEFERLRQEHASAFHTLSNEIQKLVQHRPTISDSTPNINTASSYGRGSEYRQVLGLESPSTSPTNDANNLVAKLMMDLPSASGIMSSSSKNANVYSNMDTSVNIASTTAPNSTTSNTSNTNNTNINNDNSITMNDNGIRDLVKVSVASAIEDSQKQWTFALNTIMQLHANNTNANNTNANNTNASTNANNTNANTNNNKNNNTNTNNNTNNDDEKKNNNSNNTSPGTNDDTAIKLGMLMDRVAQLEAQAIAATKSYKKDKDTIKELCVRMDTLEETVKKIRKSGVTFSESNESNDSDNNSNLKALADRMEALEVAIEAEHESSLLVLNSLLANSANRNSQSTIQSLDSKNSPMLSSSTLSSSKIIRQAMEPSQSPSSPLKSILKTNSSNSSSNSSNNSNSNSNSRYKSYNSTNIKQGRR